MTGHDQAIKQLLEQAEAMLPQQRTARDGHSGYDRKAGGTQRVLLPPHWPAPVDDAAFYGLAGDIVRILDQLRKPIPWPF